MTSLGQALPFAIWVVLVSCAARVTDPGQLAAEEARALNEASNMLLEEMPPEERQAFLRRVENHVISEIQAAASSCGTSVTFTDEPEFESRSVLIDSTATPEQIACLQEQHPYAKPQP